MMADKVKVDLKVNGRRYVELVEPRHLLADFLRHAIGLKGTHIGCEHGVCGVCTVLIDGETARSCLHFAVDVDGCEITTVEGFGSQSELDPVQQAFHEHHALQCGFCTPGMLMTVHELLAENDNPTPSEIRHALANNLCRCTGYVNIVKAVEHAARRIRQEKSKLAGTAS
jgi:carbon-monoxide dehydrogenase small subunit